MDATVDCATCAGSGRVGPDTWCPVCQGQGSLKTNDISRSIDWSKMSAHEVASALRTIPRKIAYAWRRDRYGGWVREDADEYLCARAATVGQTEVGTWRGPPTLYTKKRPHGHSSHDQHHEVFYQTAEAAKTAYDDYLRSEGWLIDETDDGSGGAPDGREIHQIVVNGETVSVSQGAYDDGHRVWWEVNRDKSAPPESPNPTEILSRVDRMLAAHEDLFDDDATTLTLLRSILKRLTDDRNAALLEADGLLDAARRAVRAYLGEGTIPVTNEAIKALGDVCQAVSKARGET